MSGISKRVSGSWVSGDYGIMKTATDTITTLPAVLYPNDTTATVGLKGNMEQNGTPTPSNPIDVNGVGVRTENLLDMSTVHAGYHLDITTGLPIGYGNSRMATLTPINVSQFSAVTIAYTSVGDTIQFMYSIFDSTDTLIERATGKVSGDSINVSSAAKLYIAFYRDTALTINSVEDAILNEGTTPQSYEPYGYKIPISSGGVTTNIYLGSTQTVRAIKKVVFDGSEDWQGTDDTVSKYLFIWNYDYKVESGVTCMSTHYSGANNIVSGDNIPNNSACFYKGDSPRVLYLKGSEPITLADFKAYLAQQYANGTPVTVWYVLATPTTGMVNEPIRKIGDYADTVSGITIPTTAGANSFDVLTTLKPSEVTVNYKGWHPVADVHERENGAWT